MPDCLRAVPLLWFTVAELIPLPAPSASMATQAGHDSAFSASPARDDDEMFDSSTYECNICYEVAREPVVTMCGHLYCWPCLYRWMQVQNLCKVCPVCKAGIAEDKVVPIYGRGGVHEDPRGKHKPGVRTQQIESLEVVPRRPAGQRPAPTSRGAAGQHSGNVNLQPGLGIIPMLFGLNNNSGNGGYSEPLTPEQQHQAFLSRLLLMLGSFVIMCLLLF